MTTWKYAELHDYAYLLQKRHTGAQVRNGCSLILAGRQCRPEAASIGDSGGIVSSPNISVMGVVVAVGMAALIVMAMIVLVIGW
jgi:hypothetical protein